VITINYSKKIDTGCSRRALRILHLREGRDREEADEEAIYKLCLILKIMSQKS